MLNSRLIRGAVILTLMALQLVVCGCGFRDVDRRHFVVTIGVDKAQKIDNGYKVELKLAIPSSQEKFGTNQSIIVQEEAETITEAVRVIKSEVDKELDFGQMKAVIFGEKLMNEPHVLEDVMDWFSRRRDIQMITWMGIGRPNALAVLNSNPKTERLPSNQLFLFFGGTGTETPYVVSEYLFDLRRRMAERGLDPILPIIETREQDQLTINKVAVFNKERRVLNLNPEETKLFNTFYHNIGKSDVKVKDEGYHFVIAADNIRTSVNVRTPPGGKPVIRASIRFTGIIEEAHQPISLSEIRLYERLAEKEITNRTKELFVKLQRAGVDPIGIGLKYRAGRMVEQAAWEQWQRSYPQLPVEVRVKVRLFGSGVIE